MSLTTTSLKDNILQLYFFKLRANIDSFSSLVLIQVIAIGLSLGGSGSFGTSSDSIRIEGKVFSSDLVIIFTMIWAFTTAITITTKPNRNHDFTFITTRLTASLGNVLFLMTAMVIAAVTAMLSSYFIQLLSILIYGDQISFIDRSLSTLLLGIGSTTLYLILISSIGYFIGTLVQMSKLFIVVVPVVLLGSIYIDAFLNKKLLIGRITTFYFMEASFGMFLLKTVITTIIFFMSAMHFLYRMEVRR